MIKNKIVPIVLGFIFLVQVAFAGGFQVTIDGMTCSGCAKSITSKLKEHPEVADVSIDLKKGQGKITFHPDKTLSEEQIKKSIVDAGYEVKKITVLK